MITDHQPIALDTFNGLYGIDDYTESVPADHFIDALNLISKGNEIKTRDGFKVSSSYGAIQQFIIYRRQGEASRILALDNAGTLYDITTGTLLWNKPGTTGVAVGFFNNRAYLSPHDGVSGIAGEFTYVYNGTTIRKTAGSAPAGSSTATISASAGIIEAGTHIFAWVYETDTGFVTKPGPAQVLEFDGTKKVSFTIVPVGPSGTAARRLIASRAIQDYNGNEEAYEMFFVPGGRINNNVDTTLTDVDFFDADLQLSADYTYDQFAEIPSVVFIAPFGNKMAFGAPNSDKNLVYVSKALEPESVNELAGFISFDPHETEGVKDATEFRDSLYVVKQNKTYSVRDNTYEPSTWKSITVDSSIGGDVNSIAQYWDKKGARVEFFVVSSKSGLQKFNGIYEPIASSRKIKNWWNRINVKYYHTMQTIFDQDHLLLYILAPFDGAISPNYIIVGDYENGFDSERIKWHLWSFQDFSPSSIGIDVDFTTKKKVLKVSSLSGNIYEQEQDRRNDNSSFIPCYIRTALVGAPDNSIHHFGAIGLRIKGSGNIKIELFGQDDIDYFLCAPVALSANPGKEFVRECFFQSERCSVKLSIENLNEWFSLRKINVYANEIFASRPG